MWRSTPRSTGWWRSIPTSGPCTRRSSGWIGGPFEQTQRIEAAVGSGPALRDHRAQLRQFAWRTQDGVAPRALATALVAPTGDRGHLLADRRGGPGPRQRLLVDVVGRHQTRLVGRSPRGRRRSSRRSCRRSARRSTCSARSDESSPTELGLPVGCEVLVGTGDDHAAAVGAGAVRPGVVADVTGTAEPIGAPADPTGVRHDRSPGGNPCSCRSRLVVHRESRVRVRGQHPVVRRPARG